MPNHKKHSATIRSFRLKWIFILYEIFVPKFDTILSHQQGAGNIARWPTFNYRHSFLYRKIHSNIFSVQRLSSNNVSLKISSSTPYRSGTFKMHIMLNLQKCLWTCLQVCGSKRLDCHADAHTLSRCTQGIHPGFETQGRCHQKSIAGVSVAPQKGFMSSKNFV